MAAVAVVVARSVSPSIGVSDRAGLAHFVYKRLAAPAFAVSFVSALIPLLLNTNYYFVVTKFMHPKLTLAVAVIALHHIIGAKLRRLSGGQPGGGLTGLAWGVFGCAIGAATLAVLKPF